MTGAEAVVKALIENEVKCIFGIPGLQSLELYNELSLSNIRNVLVAHEVGASFMADGYARASGRPGVCLGISGPGLTNMLTGLAEARGDSSPLVAIIILPADKEEKAFKVHELDDEGLAGKVAKDYRKVEDAGEARSAINRAFHRALSGEPGPVVVGIPADLLKEKVRNEKPTAMNHGQSAYSDSDIDNAVAMIKSSARIGLYCGGGALEAAEEVKLLAERLGASIGTTVSGRGVVSEEEGNCVGFGDGVKGLRQLTDFFKTNDLMIALGCRFSFVPAMGWTLKQPDKMIQVDTEKGNIGRNYAVDLAIEGNCKEVLEEMIVRLEKENGTTCQQKMEREPGNLPVIDYPDADFVRPDNFFRTLREEASDDTLLVTDSGGHQLWALTDYRVTRPRTFISPVDYQSMGFGVPAAIGAKLAKPDAPVICVTGDGGLLMSGFEILTALREQVAVVFVVFNDGHLGLIRDGQKKRYGREECVSLRVPNLEQLAESFGIPYCEVKRDHDSRTVIRSVLENGGPYLVNVNIKYEKLSPFAAQVNRNTFSGMSLKDKVGSVLSLAKGHLKNKLRNK